MGLRLNNLATSIPVVQIRASLYPDSCLSLATQYRTCQPTGHLPRRASTSHTKFPPLPEEEKLVFNGRAAKKISCNERRSGPSQLLVGAVAGWRGALVAHSFLPPPFLPPSGVDGMEIFRCLLIRLVNKPPRNGHGLTRRTKR